VRVLLDTNVLVSALHFRGSNPRRVLELILRGEHQLVTGPVLLQELEDVLIEVCGWEQGQARAARLQVEDVAEVVTPRSRPKVCRDPDDDEVLAVAQWGAVDVVVTGDKDLLVLAEHAGARIVTPRALLDWPEGGEG
jgi:uncharacterized protein